MPVSYPAGTIKEHKAVREAVGLFDVSHMGEVFLRGPRVREAIDKLTTNAVASAPVGKAADAAKTKAEETFKKKDKDADSKLSLAEFSANAGKGGGKKKP